MRRGRARDDDVPAEASEPAQRRQHARITPASVRDSALIGLLAGLIVFIAAIPTAGSAAGGPSRHQGPGQRVHILRQCCDNPVRCRSARRRRLWCPPSRRPHGIKRRGPRAR
ncbi:hypothetical protein ACFVSN_18485 [Kitasatospora sp. NPDC057904]|uniref:hypothetical protein n=1 Tax=Kitasatospora sp. NPDC057904 TaxID=3346275 RepID=UPI0036D8DCDF